MWGLPWVSSIYKYIPLDAGEGNEAKTTKESVLFKAKERGIYSGWARFGMAIVRAGTDRSKILVQVKRGGGGGCTVWYGFRAEMTRKRVWARGSGSIFSKLFFQLPFSSALTLDQRYTPTKRGLNAISVMGFVVNKILYEDIESESEGFRRKKN